MAKVQVMVGGVEWELDTDKQKIEVVPENGEIQIFVEPKKPNVGDKVTLGGIKWKILDITEKGYICLGDSIGNKSFGNNNDWKKSSIRKYLNGEFYEKLAEEIGAANIIPFKRDLLSLDGQTEYGTCEDKVSIMAFDERRKYRSLIPNTGYYWWLLTPYSTKCNEDERWICVVSPRGYVNDDDYYGDSGVRPFCIFASSLFEFGE